MGASASVASAGSVVVVAAAGSAVVVAAAGSAVVVVAAGSAAVVSASASASASGPAAAHTPHCCQLLCNGREIYNANGHMQHCHECQWDQENRAQHCKRSVSSDCPVLKDMLEVIGSRRHSNKKRRISRQNLMLCSRLCEAECALGWHVPSS